MSFILTASNISKQFGETRLFDGLSFTVSENDRIGIIGPNGKGKSTFLKILAGLEDVDEGSVLKSKSLSISYAEQLVPFSDEGTVQGLIDKELTQRNARGLDFNINEVISYLDRFGIKDLDAPLSSFSGGQKKKVHLSFILAEDSDLVLLDEPSNHLDVDSIAQLEEILSSLYRSIMMISHDRWLLEAFSSQILEINSIYPEGYFISEGGYEDYIIRREEFLDADKKALDGLKNKARVEQHWLRQGAKARTTKSKHRQETALSLLSTVKSHASRRHQKKAQIEFTSSNRRTKRLLEFEKVSHGFEGTTLFEHLDYAFTAGTKMGILGPNGSGKSTILKLILGEFEPLAGEIKRAVNLKVSYFSQFTSHIEDTIPLERVLSEDGDSVQYRGSSIHVASWAGRFGFDPRYLKQPYGSLSGGEKARLRIAKLMLETPDILLLDEPTNDLDISTLEVLEDSLIEFEGALILVTHDRYMMGTICDTFLGLDGNGRIEQYASFEQYLKDLASPQKKETTETPSSTKEKDEPSPSKSKIKLSFKEQRELNFMEESIKKGEAEVSKLSGQIESNTNPEKLQSLCDELSEAQSKVDALYLRWEELEKK